MKYIISKLYLIYSIHETIMLGLVFTNIYKNMIEMTWNGRPERDNKWNGAQYASS